MTTAPKYPLIAAALVAALVLAGCDRDRTDDVSTASNPAVAPETSSADANAPSTPAATSAEAYPPPPVDQAASSMPPANDAVDAPMSNDPNRPSMQGDEELRQREQEQHSGTAQDGARGDGQTGNTGNPTP